MNTVPTRPEGVPPWLDLDAVVDPAIRQEIAALTDEGTTHAVNVRSWAKAVYAVVQRHNAAVTRAVNQGAERVDLHDLIDPLTHVDHLLELAQQISDDTGHITGSVADTASWVAEVDAELAAELGR